MFENILIDIYIREKLNTTDFKTKNIVLKR